MALAHELVYTGYSSIEHINRRGIPTLWLFLRLLKKKMFFHYKGILFIYCVKLPELLWFVILGYLNKIEFIGHDGKVRSFHLLLVRLRLEVRDFQQAASFTTAGDEQFILVININISD